MPGASYISLSVCSATRWTHLLMPATAALLASPLNHLPSLPLSPVTPSFPPLPSCPSASLPFSPPLCPSFPSPPPLSPSLPLSLLSPPSLPTPLLQVWGLGSPDPNFTLEGHQKGVNCIDYFTGGDRPYLISGSDDQLVKVGESEGRGELGS